MQCRGADRHGLLVKLRHAGNDVVLSWDWEAVRPWLQPNTLIPDLYPENPSSGLNMGGIFFGVGAAFFPGLVALIARHVGLLATLWGIALVVGLVALVALAQTFPPASMAGGFDWGQAMSLLINPAVIILACVLFFYTALEYPRTGSSARFWSGNCARPPFNRPSFSRRSGS